MKSIKSDTHPKELYAQCLKFSPYWHHVAASPKIGINDIAMIVCRELGCEMNYCGLLKKSVPSEWEGSSDCSNELKNFNICLSQETKRYQWIDADKRPA